MLQGGDCGQTRRHPVHDGWCCPHEPRRAAVAGGSGTYAHHGRNGPVMPCRELFRNAGLGARFQSRRFDMLHSDGRRLVVHWFNLAREQRNADPAESFELFIFAWIAFNGWASCCTELDQGYTQVIEQAALVLEQVFLFVI